MVRRQEDERSGRGEEQDGRTRRIRDEGEAKKEEKKAIVQVIAYPVRSIAANEPDNAGGEKDKRI